MKTYIYTGTLLLYSLLITSCKNNEFDICKYNKDNPKSIYILMTPENCVKCLIYTREIMIPQHPNERICLIFKNIRTKEANQYVQENLTPINGDVIVDNSTYLHFDTLVDIRPNMPIKAFKLNTDCIFYGLD